MDIQHVYITLLGVSLGHFSCSHAPTHMQKEYVSDGQDQWEEQIQGPNALVTQELSGWGQCQQLEYLQQPLLERQWQDKLAYLKQLRVASVPARTVARARVE